MAAEGAGASADGNLHHGRAASATSSVFALRVGHRASAQLCISEGCAWIRDRLGPAALDGLCFHALRVLCLSSTAGSLSRRDVQPDDRHRGAWRSVGAVASRSRSSCSRRQDVAESRSCSGRNAGRWFWVACGALCFKRRQSWSIAQNRQGAVPTMWRGAWSGGSGDARWPCWGFLQGRIDMTIHRSHVSPKYKLCRPTARHAVNRDPGRFTALDTSVRIAVVCHRGSCRRDASCGVRARSERREKEIGS